MKKEAKKEILKKQIVKFINDENRQYFQSKISKLTALSLINDKFLGLSEQDLLNASIIFNHILLDLMYSQNSDKKLGEKMKLAEDTGKKLRQLILESTGLDMAHLAKNAILESNEV